jgi:hypothetical protein
VREPCARALRANAPDLPPPSSRPRSAGRAANPWRDRVAPDVLLGSVRRLTKLFHNLDYKSGCASRPRPACLPRARALPARNSSSCRSSACGQRRRPLAPLSRSPVMTRLGRCEGLHARL